MGDDPEMAEAYLAAQATFKYFWREVAWESRRIIPGLELASVKVPFSDQEDERLGVEHLWLSDIDFDGRKIRGTVLSSPNDLTTIKQGDEVVLSLEEISDWMYVIDSKVYGAHTVNLMRSRMSRGECRGHDRAWGLQFGDASTIELVPSATARPGLLRRILGGKDAPSSDSSDPLLLADREHPASINMSPLLGETLGENPEMLEEEDDRGRRILHHLALAGSAAGVAVLLEAGADSSAVTAEGQTAIDLANTLGWPEVVRLLSGAAAS